MTNIIPRQMELGFGVSELAKQKMKGIAGVHPTIPSRYWVNLAPKWVISSENVLVVVEWKRLVMGREGSKGDWEGKLLRKKTGKK